MPENTASDFIDTFIRQRYPLAAKLADGTISEMERAAAEAEAVEAKRRRAELLSLHEIDVLALTFELIGPDIKTTATNSSEAKAKELADLKERELPFNQSYAIADFDYWSKMATWSPDEFVALSLGRDPRVVTWDKVRPHRRTSKFAANYENQKALVDRAIDACLLLGWRSKTYLSWAQSVSLDVDAGLIAACEQNGLTSRVATSTDDKRPEIIGVNASNSDSQKPRSGRPEAYDWDTFVFEIIRRANSPDGLPETRAELVRDMLEWFSLTYGKEPSESSVKSRISQIYKYLEKVKK